MRLVPMSEAPPPSPGMYHCKVVVDRFAHNDKYIMKDVVWYSSEGKWLTSESNHTVISWVDESEPDQDELWKDIDQIIFNESGGNRALPDYVIDQLKEKYQLIRK